MSTNQVDQVTVAFHQHEREALRELCEQDFREASGQIRWLVMQEFERRVQQAVSDITAKINGIQAEITAQMREEAGTRERGGGCGCTDSEKAG